MSFTIQINPSLVITFFVTMYSKDQAPMTSVSLKLYRKVDFKLILRDKLSFCKSLGN